MYASIIKYKGKHNGWSGYQISVRFLIPDNQYITGKSVDYRITGVLIYEKG